MLPHAYFIFHQGSGTISGTFEQICAQMEDYQNQVEELSGFMLEHTDYSEEEVANKLNKAKSEGRRIICVGTTSLRTIESNISKYGELVLTSRNL